ncbi:MAG TPA: type III polyketide synthase [Flavobacteriales bacterium]|nr:type III polyketide synthase [Flavobacteriales bacterium]
MSKIVALATAIPRYKYQQEDIAAYMSSELGFGLNGKSREINLLYKKTKIKNRYSVIPDYQSSKGAKVLFVDDDVVPSVDDRMELYNKEVLPLSISAIAECMKEANSNSAKKIALGDITHLITVSCTGLAAPGLEIELSEYLKLAPEISRFGVNFIGCYASFHAMKMADDICRSRKDAKVLIVSVELCTIHFQKETDKDNLLANAIFGDGAAAVLVTPDDFAAENFDKQLKMESFCTHVLHKGNKDMAWKISSKGFLMRLSSYIPDLVDEGIGPLVNSSLSRLNLKYESIDHWAIHPGGSKILEVCHRILELENGALEASYKILAEYGNMSSPTILFVLKELWDNRIAWNRPQNIFAAGFGPGITMESAVFSTAS